MNENQNEYVDINAHDNYPDSEQKIEIPTMKVIPLKKICMTIGELPTSYLETMTYYEMLIWFIEFLRNNIIPTINNNASAIQEVQSVVLALQNYINDYKDSIDSDVEELENYMNNYFENLDVQEEINNKIDELISDGTFQTILLETVGGKFYETTLDMIADESLTVNTIVTTSGYSTKNDGKGATYIIVNSSTRNAYELDNGLFAEIIENDGIKREANSTKNSFTINSNKLSGVCKSSKNPIVQEENEDSCINVTYNECLVENLNIQNPNNYQDKTAINVLTPSQRNKFDSIYIGNGFKTGIKIPTSYYSQFNDVWTSGETGILIGDPEQPSNWIGVLDFNACHFNRSKLAVKQVATNTNTICFDKCSFEGNINNVENDGLLYFRNTYFGDNKYDSNESVHVLKANALSETHFDNCTVSMIAGKFTTTPQRESLIKLNSSNGKGSKVYINGGLFNISNNNFNNSISSIYESDSNLNELFIDNVKFIPSESNTHHNYFPYYLYEGYSPLRSLNPIKNYVLNGTMKNELGNSLIGVESSHSQADSTLTNPFGGKVFSFTREGTSGAGYSNFYYKIPKHLVGKKMILETYGLSSSNKFDVRCDTMRGLGTHEMTLTDTFTTDTNRVKLFRYEVTPTNESGLIQLFIHWNDTTPGAWYKLSGVVLKEEKYKNYMSCYSDQDMLMSKSIPTNTTDAKKGDVILASTDSTNTAIGWIFDGSAWQLYNSFE